MIDTHSVGQSALMWHYEAAFKRHGIAVGQVLLTAYDIAQDGDRADRRVWAELGEASPDGIVAWLELLQRERLTTPPRSVRATTSPASCPRCRRRPTWRPSWPR